MNIKLIYTDWIEKDDIKFPLPNGNIKYLNDKAKERAKTINLRGHINNDGTVTKNCQLDLLHDDSVRFSQIHDYFYKTWMKFFGPDNMVSLDEVDPSDENIYVYVIELNYSNDNFVKRTLTKDNGETIEYTIFQNIPERIYTLLRQNKIKLIFSYVDNKCLEDSLRFLTTRFNLKGVPLKNVIVLSGNVNLGYQGSIKQKQICCAVFDVAVVMTGYPSPGSLGYQSDYVRFDELDSSKFRNKRFLCWNRSLNRSHRYGLLYLAKKYNLLEQGYWSFLNSFDNCTDCLNYFYKMPFSKMKSLCKELEDMIPVEIDTVELNNEQRLSFRTIDNNMKSLYADSYLHIVSETEFRDKRTPYITEKTFRPIMNLQPFIMVNNSNTLTRLHEMGFKTFHPYIDESYDLIDNPQQRWEMITNEILKFNNMPIEQLHDWYYSITDILLYNQKHLQSFVRYNMLTEFLEELKNGYYE